MRSTPWQTSEFPEGSTAAEMPAMKNFDTILSTAGMAILASIALLGCKQPTPPSAEAPFVRAVEVQETALDRTAALTGGIQARHESNLGFRVAGKVVERPVDVGQRVAAGDLLARLDDQDQRNAVTATQSDVAAALAFVEESRSQEERQRKLLADGYTTRTQYDNAHRRHAQAQADLDSAQAKLRSARDTLSYTELRADRAGVISAKGAEPGQVVASGQMVVRLADPSEREAIFQIPGASFRLEGRLKPPPVEVRLVSNPDIVTEGTIREVSPGADPVTRTYTVKVALIDAPASFLLGSAVVGRAKLPARSVVNLPSSALFQTAGGEPAVWVVKRPEETVGLRPVSVLQYDTGTVTVASGLSGGETVVIGGGQKLRSGQKVSVKQGSGA
jgi:RND family efflux transporter MFP subunit